MDREDEVNSRRRAMSAISMMAFHGRRTPYIRATGGISAYARTLTARNEYVNTAVTKSRCGLINDASYFRLMGGRADGASRICVRVLDRIFTRQAGVSPGERCRVYASRGCRRRRRSRRDRLRARLKKRCPQAQTQNWPRRYLPTSLQMSSGDGSSLPLVLHNTLS